SQDRRLDALPRHSGLHGSRRAARVDEPHRIRRRRQAAERTGSHGVHVLRSSLTGAAVMREFVVPKTDTKLLGEVRLEYAFQLRAHYDPPAVSHTPKGSF